MELVIRQYNFDLSMEFNQMKLTICCSKYDCLLVIPYGFLCYLSMGFKSVSLKMTHCKLLVKNMISHLFHTALMTVCEFYSFCLFNEYQENLSFPFI